jgi:hypothetical protein
MNCAKCANPSNHLGRTPGGLKLGVDIRLVFVQQVGDCDQYRCPRCRGKFLFTNRTSPSDLENFGAAIPT